MLGVVLEQDQRSVSGLRWVTECDAVKTGSELGRDMTLQ